MMSGTRIPVPASARQLLSELHLRINWYHAIYGAGSLRRPGRHTSYGEPLVPMLKQERRGARIKSEAAPRGNKFSAKDWMHASYRD